MCIATWSIILCFVASIDVVFKERYVVDETVEARYGDQWIEATIKQAWPDGTYIVKCSDPYQYVEDNGRRRQGDLRKKDQIPSRGARVRLLANIFLLVLQYVGLILMYVSALIIVTALFAMTPETANGPGS